ncbi:MAG: hypothetical protein ACP5OS_07345 [Leptospirillia bacterium]
MTAVDKIRQEGFEEGFAQGFEQGFEEGFAQGVKQGYEREVEETREDFVKKLLEKGRMSLEEISRTLELDLPWVKELAGRLPEGVTQMP